ncbi:MAG: hypothetical protein ACREMV_03610 [Gemmatimonadales bacterium]
MVRYRLLGFGVGAALLGGAAPVAAQGLTLDARSVAMGGVTIDRGGAIARYNPAYRSVPAREITGRPKTTIPIPLGLIQVLEDSAAFDFDESYWNPVRFVSYALSPLVKSFYYQIKEPRTPTSDVEFTIGQNELIVDLGEARLLVPTERFGLTDASRLFDMGLGFKGVRVGVGAWLHRDLGMQLDSALTSFLRDAAPARNNQTYSVLGDGLVQGGFAPMLGYSGRVLGDATRGLYLGGALRYYVGVSYGKTRGTGSVTTGDTIFAGPNPVTPGLDAITAYSGTNRSFGTGWGGDLGVVWVSGPFEIGLGATDIGVTLTWPEARIERAVWDTTLDEIVTTPIATSTETETEIPMAWVANLAYQAGERSTIGAQLINTTRGTRVGIGVEQRIGMVALRGGVVRDQLKQSQFSGGIGFRFGSFGLDVAITSYAGGITGERAVALGSSISIY